MEIRVVNFFCESECTVMLIEPKDTLNNGNAYRWPCMNSAKKE